MIATGIEKVVQKNSLVGTVKIADAEMDNTCG
jgi:hypothetical protein